MRQRHLLVATSVAIAALVAAACQPVVPPPTPPATPRCSAAPGSTIPGQWVATVDPDGPATTEVVTFDAATPAEKEAEVAELDESGTVLAVEPDRVVAALADSVVPGDDPHYSVTAPTQVEALTEGGFPDAWTAGFGGSGATIAILDSGVQAAHEDLAGRVVQGADLVSGTTAQPWGTTDYGRIDPYGHGTHVAGIAAANDSTVGGIGGAPLATILPVRVLNSCGSGSFSNVAAGIRWAADRGANVISMSLGGSGICSSSPVVADAVAYARGLGVLLLAAAGNSSTNGVGIPANCDGVVAVGASQGNGTDATRAGFSNYGLDVEIAASGSSIYSTDSPGPTAYTTLSGTSMATPFVAAAGALVYQRCLAQLPAPSTARGDRLATLLRSHLGPIVPSGFPHSLRISATGGTYTLTYEGAETTAPIAFDATAAQVDAALEALSGIGLGNVTVTAAPPASGESSRFSITWSGAAASNAPITFDVSALTGSIATVTPPPFPGRLDVAAATGASCV